MNVFLVIYFPTIQPAAAEWVLIEVCTFSRSTLKLVMTRSAVQRGLSIQIERKLGEGSPKKIKRHYGAFPCLSDVEGSTFACMVRPSHNSLSYFHIKIHPIFIQH